MAVFTRVSQNDAERVCAACGLGSLHALVPVAAGSVNTNYLVDTDQGRKFMRLYEEQGPDGVEYEARLLRYLQAAGLAVPRRVPGPVLSIGGKPVGLFDVVAGIESCQRAVTEVRAARIGQWLARAHVALDGFDQRRVGRFSLDDVEARLAPLAAHPRSDLAPVVARLRDVLGQVRGAWPTGARSGVIHGDLFRDNVRWDGDRIVAVIDWESASDGLRIYDLMVAVLAWSFGDAMQWNLASALVRGYDETRPLSPVERGALRVAGLAAAVRFATTRITDYELRPAIGERVHKDYRRFVARLDALAALTDGELESRLLSTR